VLSELEHRGNDVSGFTDTEALKSPIGFDNVVGLSLGEALHTFGQDEYPVVRPCVRKVIVVPGCGLHDFLESLVVVPQFIDYPCDKQALILRCLHIIFRIQKNHPVGVVDSVPFYDGLC
jgi:hypothetical protein